MDGSVLAVAVTTACEAKTAAVPTCGPWSSVTQDPGEFDAGAPDVAALQDAGASDASVESDAEAGGAGAGGSGGSGQDGTKVPSCQGMTGNECQGESCCSNILVPGDTFLMGRSLDGSDMYAPALDDEQPEHDVTVSDFNLNEYEVTVGRFREFVEAFDGTWPVQGAGAHPLVKNSGWQSVWDASLASTQEQLKSNLKCDSMNQLHTWRDTPSGTEEKPINCVSWYEAFAFCAWDGGRLPTEVEWEFAAAGGIENRLYPWGSEAPDSTRAVYDSAAPDPIAVVGSLPLGAGSWGHKDLAGNLWEWILDLYDADFYKKSKNCAICVNLSTGSDRVVRGGDFLSDVSCLRAAYRTSGRPAGRERMTGFRCARSVP
jgi:formylglycine-generating enzyme required for sulfatase activity